MNLVVYLYAVFLCVVKDINGLKLSKFQKGYAYVEKVCATSIRVFARVGVSSAAKCAMVCGEASGCDAIFFSAVDGSCIGCMKLTALSSELVPSTANVYYQLVNANFSTWTYGTSAYMLDVSRTMNFNDAKIYCQLSGAHVVVPGSQDEQDFLAAQLLTTPTGVSVSWIGITDTQNTNTFLVEHTGEMVNYTSWHQGEPNDDGGNEPCTAAARFTGWTWHDCLCSNLFNVVCQRD